MAPESEMAPASAGPEALRRDGRALFWHVVLGLDLALIAFLFVSQLRVGLTLLLAPDSAAAQRFEEALSNPPAGAAWLNAIGLLFLFGLLPAAWVAGTRVKAWEGTRRYLSLADPVRSLGRGALLALPFVVGVLVLSLLYTLATEGADGLRDAGAEENPAVEGLLSGLTWPLAAAIALSAGIGEEVFFRGILLKRVGVWGQAALFGLFHSAGGYLPQIAVAFAIGAVFGLLVRRGASLWLVIAAHATYDFILLALALVAGG